MNEHKKDYFAQEIEPSKVEVKYGKDDTLLEFPCDFPIKIMGLSRIDFLEKIAQAIQKYAPDFDPAGTEVRFSAGRKYVSVTCVINAQSKQQLDSIYMALSNHPMVKIVL